MDWSTVSVFPREFMSEESDEKCRQELVIEVVDIELEKMTWHRDYRLLAGPHMRLQPETEKLSSFSEQYYADRHRSMDLL